MIHFKEGDKVRLIKHGILEGEQEDWTVQAGLQIGEVYILEEVRMDDAYHPKVYIKLNSGDYRGDTWYFHPGHFEYAKKNNKQRIAERRQAHAKSS